MKFLQKYDFSILGARLNRKYKKFVKMVTADDLKTLPEQAYARREQKCVLKKVLRFS